MRWTPENIETLFRTVCETQNLTINVVKVANNWPTTEGEDCKGPTPKAIKEFLGKYKKSVKPGASLNISFSAKEAAETNSPAGTPRKRKPSAKDASPVKKAKVVKEESEDEDDE
ncbi:hypothetical protein BO78DRAFT_422509 [Aspergillus terreus]|uniref:Uncharacterized protein n=1 Tax=Aspergillus terreus TaxID=33178 RepID=A0A5M3ZDQ7_ASPTE|nr:hypothetical protein ATETN484_0017006200 [Aspergillus terreus]GFF21733.1 hypothetical protein BO78DRAFT_422509 [Aspergillus terreus]